jgi:4-hydroxybenzoate polyprenyltransferase
MTTPPAATPSSFPIFDLLKAMRPAQWTKNAIVLAAFFFALGDRSQPQLTLGLGYQALLAALCFCLVSSGVYIVNDLSDIEADRLHPHKRLRPIAAGRIRPSTAWGFALLLLLGGVGGGLAVNPNAGLVLAGYVVLQLIYTFWLKRIPLVDIMIIAAGFVLRAITGALAVEVPISTWLLLCTFLLALFLALCKRRHEKKLLDDAADQHRAVLEQYDPQLMDQLITITSACTILSYAIYTLLPETVLKFGSHGLGLTIPFVIFGIFRYLDLVYRHGKGGQPEQILLTDAPLLTAIALFGLTAGIVIIL